MWTVAPKTQRIPYPATESRVGVGSSPAATHRGCVPGLSPSLCCEQAARHARTVRVGRHLHAVTLVYGFAAVD